MTEERFCDNCGDVFEPKAHNAIYCSGECRRVSTNEKVLEKYYEKKERRKGGRICELDDCYTILSRYNDENICEAHKTERLILRLTDYGWDEDSLREDWSF